MLTRIQQRTRLITLPLLLIGLMCSLLLLAHSGVLSEHVNVTDLTRDHLVGFRHIVALAQC